MRPLGWPSLNVEKTSSQCKQHSRRVSFASTASVRFVQDFGELSHLCPRSAQRDHYEMSEVADVSFSSSSPSPSSSATPRKAYVTLAVLLAINLLNYVDRFTIAGVLLSLQHYFHVGDFEAALFNTVFICAYMLFAPVCGYLGDRYTRKWIMFVGIAIWITAVLGSTFVPQGPPGDEAKYVWLFMLLRGIVGIGEASYSTVAPAIIADLFSKDQRSKALMVFYFAIPVGMGLGYIVGSYVSAWTGMWQWGVRVTPLAGVALLFVIMFVLEEPPRAAADHAENMRPTSFLDDLKYLARNKTFVASTMGYTGLVFVTGSMTYWVPQMTIYSRAMGGAEPTDAEKESVNFSFGVIAVVTGIIGVAVGGAWAQVWRKHNPRADPLVCGISALMSVPFIFLSLVATDLNQYAAYFFVFMGIMFLCFNWSVVPDMVMYVVVPTRRSSAMAIQIMVSHLFGDATSPLIVGAISDRLRGDDLSNSAHFYSLQSALYLPNFVLVLGGLGFLVSAWFVEADKEKCAQDMHGEQTVDILDRRQREETEGDGVHSIE